MQSFQFLLCLIILCLYLSKNFLYGCKCRVQLPVLSYCNAHWVAHVKIEQIHDKQRLPPNASKAQVSNNVRYDVKYLQIFKRPAEFANSTSLGLPNVIFTPNETAACGIFLEQGHEYLLSGRSTHGTLITYLCGQILYDDLKKSKYEDVLEWTEVPNSLKNRLNTTAFNNTECDNLLLFL